MELKLPRMELPSAEKGETQGEACLVEALESGFIFMPVEFEMQSVI